MRFISKLLLSPFAAIANFAYTLMKITLIFPLFLILATALPFYLAGMVLAKVITDLWRMNFSSLVSTLLKAPVFILAPPLFSLYSVISFFSLAASPFRGIEIFWRDESAFFRFDRKLYDDFNTIITGNRYFTYWEAHLTYNVVDMLKLNFIVLFVLNQLFSSTRLDALSLQAIEYYLGLSDNLPANPPAGEPANAGLEETHQLAQGQFNAIKAMRQMPINDSERKQIVNDKCLSGKEMLDKYDALLRNLADVCPILVDIPEREDAILLVKQYETGGVWKNVPLSSTVFDKTSLSRWYAHNPTNPKNNDSLTEPSKYNHCNTRYVFHSLYNPDDDNDNEVISGELNEQILLIRNALSSVDLKPLKKTVGNHSVNGWFSWFSSQTSASDSAHDHDANSTHSNTN